ncbi:MAG: hypothetical protein WAK76_01360 [Trebonia sp.]
MPNPHRTVVPQAAVPKAADAWPAERDPGSATYRIQVRLARGALRPLLRMGIDIDRWSSSSTALELIPGGYVRPTTAPTSALAIFCSTR